MINDHCRTRSMSSPSQTYFHGGNENAAYKALDTVEVISFSKLGDCAVVRRVRSFVTPASVCNA